VKTIADTATQGNQVRLPPVFIQPIAAEDVATAVGRIAVGTPLNGTVEVAGPQRFRFDEFIRQVSALAMSARSRRRLECAVFRRETERIDLGCPGDASIGEIPFERLAQPGDIYEVVGDRRPCFSMSGVVAAVTSKWSKYEKSTSRTFGLLALAAATGLNLLIALANQILMIHTPAEGRPCGLQHNRILLGIADMDWRLFEMA
jgi:hypothetical protein